MPINKKTSDERMTDKKTTEKFDDKKQQTTKDRAQKEMAAEQAKPKCRICGKYTDKKTSPQCFGHGGGGGGGGSGGGDSGEKASKDDAAVLTKKPDEMDAIKQVAMVASYPTSELAAQQMTLKDDLKFNADVISDLLSSDLLVIHNDRENGILSIKVRDIKLLSEEQRNELKKFVNAVVNELNEFKKENRIFADCHTLEEDKEGNILSLRIALPHPALYDAFIQRLANKFLLPVNIIEQQPNEKVVYERGVNHFNPSPLTTKPIPSAKINKLEDETKKADDKKSIRPKSPLDGLKPKGIE